MWEVTCWVSIHYSHAVSNVKAMPHSGHPQSTTPVEYQYLRIMARRKRDENAIELRNALLEATGTGMSIQTLRNRLHTNNLTARRPTQTPLLQPQHRGSRNRWAT